MKIIDHGKWIPYKPDLREWPDAPSNALFAKRESDGVDWYHYVNPSEDEKKRNRLFSSNFREDSVKIAFAWHESDKQWIIGPSVVDATMIFPANHYVREILDFGSVDEEEIIAAFRNKAIDPETSEILGDRYELLKRLAPEAAEIAGNVELMLRDLIARVMRLEERLK